MLRVKNPKHHKILSEVPENRLLNGLNQEGKSEYVLPEVRGEEDSDIQADSKITINYPTVTNNDQKPYETKQETNPPSRLGGQKSLEKAAKVLGIPELLSPDNHFLETSSKAQSTTPTEEKEEVSSRPLARTSSWTQHFLSARRLSSAAYTESETKSITSSLDSPKPRNSSVGRSTTPRSSEQYEQMLAEYASRLFYKETRIVTPSSLEEFQKEIEFMAELNTNPKYQRYQNAVAKLEAFKQMEREIHQEYGKAWEQYKGSVRNSAMQDSPRSSERASSSFLGRLSHRPSSASTTSQDESDLPRKFSWMSRNASSSRPSSAASIGSSR